MRTFDFYEFAGIIAPGAVVITGVAVIHPPLKQLVGDQGLSLGEFGIFVVLAYVAGHLVQAVGNLLEWCWWKLCGGWPSDWVGRRKGDLLNRAQLERLESVIEAQLHLPGMAPCSEMTRKKWHPVVRQAYAAVAAAGRAGRIESFNGNYGLCRGIAAAFVVVFTLSLFQDIGQHWPERIALLVALGLALARMHRFGVHYARELFVQCLTLDARKEES
ncbi:MAG: hypothetical protein CHACPFDD_00871 [Phycisphaerae bacterium]|nr:hypothetical protein [Phycisphaerae bacterium]